MPQTRFDAMLISCIGVTDVAFGSLNISEVILTIVVFAAFL